MEFIYPHQQADETDETETILKLSYLNERREAGSDDVAIIYSQRNGYRLSTTEAGDQAYKLLTASCREWTPERLGLTLAPLSEEEANALIDELILEARAHRSALKRRYATTGG